MNDRKRTASEKLDNLTDAVVEDILAASDTEIIAEANEDSDDVDGVVSKVQHVIKRAIAMSGKSRMATAKEAYHAVSSSEPIKHFKLLSFQEKVALMERAAKRKDGSEESLTLAARNLENLTENDLDAKLEALLILGVIDDEGNVS